MKNNEVVAAKLTMCPTEEDFAQADVMSLNIDVQEGDVITLNFGDIANKQPTTREGERQTFLEVLAIGEHI